MFTYKIRFKSNYNILKQKYGAKYFNETELPNAFGNEVSFKCELHTEEPTGFIIPFG